MYSSNFTSIEGEFWYSGRSDVNLGVGEWIDVNGTIPSDQSSEMMMKWCLYPGAGNVSTERSDLSQVIHL